MSLSVATVASNHTPVPAALEAVEVVARYPGLAEPAVAGVTLTVARGSLFGLLGPNGAGKTTLLSMACALIRPSAGSLRILGLGWDSDPVLFKRSVGFVPQGIALYPTLTARENLRVFGRMHGLSGGKLRARIDYALGIADLRELADRRVQTYSGGVQRRLNLVCALLHEPSVLILDEPTVGIDPQSRNFIHTALRELNKAGTTILYTSHQLDEVENLCDTVAIMDRGRIVAQGTMADVLSQHVGMLELRLGEPPPAALCSEIRALPDVQALQVEDRTIMIRSAQPFQLVVALIPLLAARGVSILALSLGAQNLEHAFLAITGTRLRD
ncbi:MAG TPA: ABC transporter ATP-binding protein [Acidiferrobacter sp.]|nr:ABC transporter ATP-binding protein [Acidiferrobacter sp.]